MVGARWLDSWWRLLVAAGGAVLALTGPYFGALSDNPVWQIVGLVVGIVGLLASAVFPLIEKLRNNRELQELRDSIAETETKARADFLLLVEFSLTPLVQKLAKVVHTRRNTREFEAEAASLRQQALGMAREVIGREHKSVRANYFKLDYSLPQPRLLAKGSTARPPRDYFDLNSDEGEEVLNMLAENRSVFCANVRRDAPQGWDSSKPRNYETFISVTAVAGLEMEPDGMMTLDSGREGDLNKADISMLKLIATIVALSESQRNASA